MATNNSQKNNLPIGKNKAGLKEFKFKEDEDGNIFLTTIVAQTINDLWNLQAEVDNLIQGDKFKNNKKLIHVAVCLKFILEYIDETTCAVGNKKEGKFTKGKNLTEILNNPEYNNGE